MKKTININLGGFVFQIDEDAYDRLNNYLESLKRKFTNIEEQEEIIQDIEYRFAELFGTGLNKRLQVVSLNMVNQAIATMGEPEEIENELESNDSQQEQSTRTNTTYTTGKKLFRDPDDKIFAGVLSGLSKYFGVQDPIWFRIIMIVLTIASIGIPTVLIYIIFWIVMPEAKTSSERLQMQGAPINLDNIEDQVKKNINSDEIRRTSARVSSKIGDAIPTILKIVGVFLIFLFALKLLGLSFGLLGGGFLAASFEPEYVNLIFSSKTLFYIGLFSLYALLAVPLIFALYLAVKLFTKQKVNWAFPFALAFILFILSLLGMGFSAYDVIGNFTSEAEQTNYVALENPTVDELEILFPHEDLKEDFRMNLNFGDNDDENEVVINDFEINAGLQQIKINNVSLDIKLLTEDSIFKLSKTRFSHGKSYAKAEENIEHITHEFELVNENMIAIPSTMILENETKWRNQSIDYTLYVPVGKKIHFGDNANKVVDRVSLNDNFSKKQLSNNTWQMTKAGLECISCDEPAE